MPFVHRLFVFANSFIFVLLATLYTAGCSGEASRDATRRASGNNISGDSQTEEEAENLDQGANDENTGDSQDNGSNDDPEGGGDTESVDSDVSAVISITIVAPESRTSIEAGQTIAFEANVTREGHTTTGLVAQWLSNRDGILSEQILDSDGIASFVSAGLSSGIHRIELRIIDAQGTSANAFVEVGVCGWTTFENFDEAINSERWLQLGNASRTGCGWLELTGNSQGRKGAFYNIGRSINPGNLNMRFKISTGQCAANATCELSNCNSSAGADGFALSVIDVEAGDLTGLFADAFSGGGLGYGVNGPYGNRAVNAFHLEFDTWHNVNNGNTQRHTDPTAEDHVEITLNGDPSDSQGYAPMPDLEDNLWHQVQVRIQGSEISIWVDDVLMIEQTIEDYQFKGGLIGFSGTTGFYTNFHRIDSIELNEVCDFD